MLSIRFHGRSGQGAKTASQIFGTAAFLDGYQAQDSPIYEAEKSGSDAVAYIPKLQPVEDYLKLQGRFRHLFEPTIQKEAIAHIQAGVNMYWDGVKKAEEMA